MNITNREQDSRTLLNFMYLLNNIQKSRVESELQKVYTQFDKDMEDYYQRLDENFKEKIISKAKNLHE